MLRVLLFGAVLAALAAIEIWVSTLLGLNFQNVLVGISAGAVLGLVRQRTPVARAAAFGIGFGVSLLFYGLRLALLPATVAGNVVATVGMIFLLTVIAALTKDRLGLWAMLLGGLVFAASYDAYFIATPWYALTQIPGVATGVLVSCSFGFLITILVELREARGGVGRIDPMAPAPSEADELATAQVGAPAAAPAGPAGPAGPEEPNAGLQVFGGDDGGPKQ